MAEYPKAAVPNPAVIAIGTDRRSRQTMTNTLTTAAALRVTQSGWKSGKRGAMIAVQRAFNWAAKAGLLTDLGGRSPLASHEKPDQRRRELIVSAEEYQTILGFVKDEPFHDLLITLWETGCRPSELFC